MRKPKVLVVDDEPDVVAFIERAMVADSFEVLTAYDGLAALDLAESEKPDVVVLDIMMPMMSGYEVCEQLKSNPNTRAIPVIFLTSAHRADIYAKSMQSGAAAVVMKPFLPPELIAQVRRQLPREKEAS